MTGRSRPILSVSGEAKRHIDLDKPELVLQEIQRVLAA